MERYADNVTIKRVITRCGCDRIIPLCLVYIFYIMLHGHLTPGGGFQGGILTVAEAKRALHPDLTHKLEGVALMLYVVLAFVGVVLGASFCQNVFYYHGDIGALFSSGTVFWMGETVAFDVFTAAVTLSIGMLSVLYPQDIDNLK